MGKLMIPPTSDPASTGRKGPAGPSGVGNETKADVSGAMMSNPGPGSGRNSGGGNMSFDSKCIKDTLK